MQEMREKINICLIGCGKFSQNFVPLFKLHPDVESVQLCDLVPERAAAAAQQFQLPVVASFEQALADPKINAVAIFSQRHLHGPQVIAALKAGKHVYSAVPCASKIEEIQEIEALVRQTRLTYSMGETGYYRSATIFCRQKMKAGEMGDFVYGEAQYNHDQRHFDFTRSGSNWRQVAGIPPMYYPTHSTSMILGSLPGVYVQKVAAFGYSKTDHPDIFGTSGQNLWNNPFVNTAMLAQLSNGGIARISENRRAALSGNTYISQFYGSEGCYEFAVAHHYFTHWAKDDPQKLIREEVSRELFPASVSSILDKPDTSQKICAGLGGYHESSPIQPTWRLPREFSGQPNGHNGTHHFLVDDFCQAAATGKLSPTNIWASARFNLPGLIAHQSALRGGELMDVPDLGDPPADWPLLELD